MAYPGALPAAGSASASDTLADAGHTSLHNTGADESRAIATKIGTGASTPTSSLVLRGTGAGTSAWGSLVLTSDVTGVLPVANGGTGQSTLTAVPLVSPDITGTVSGGATYSSPILITPEVDTINENIADNGVTVDGLNVKDSKLNTADSVVTDNYTDGSILPEHLTTGTGTSWAWASWTPTLTNMTEGNGTKTGKYIQIGKTVFFKFQFTLGSTSAMGTDPQFSVPVTAIASDANSVIGQSVYRDAGTETYFGSVYLNATTTAKFNSNATDATWLRASATPPDSTRPFTWTTNDIITAVGFYEVE